MNVPELMAQLRTEMTGNVKTDMEHLQAVAEDLKNEPNAGELLKAIGEYAFDIMPPELRTDMEARTFVNGKRIDQAYGDALALVRAGKTDEAAAILAAISEAAATYYEDDEPKYFSFRNPFEYHMYRHFYPEDTQFERAPFDFASYLALYGYVLLEQRDAVAARKALERAAKFNPVSADVRFEMAELCKFAQDLPALLKENQETLRLCTTADRTARVLANMGFYCYAVQDYFSAAVFYFESLRFAPSQPVEYELQDVLHRMKTFGQKFAPPTHGQTIDVYEKYGLQPPPNDELVNLAVVMINQAKTYQRTDLEAFFNRVAFDLTNDTQFKDEMERLAADARAAQETSPEA